MKTILESFVQKTSERAKAEGITIDAAINAALGDTREMVSGYDFATVVAAYARGYEAGDDTLQSAALRWLRGSTRRRRKLAAISACARSSAMMDYTTA